MKKIDALQISTDNVGYCIVHHLRTGGHSPDIARTPLLTAPPCPHALRPETSARTLRSWRPAQQVSVASLGSRNQNVQVADVVRCCRDLVATRFGRWAPMVHVGKASCCGASVTAPIMSMENVPHRPHNEQHLRCESIATATGT